MHVEFVRRDVSEMYLALDPSSESRSQSALFLINWLSRALRQAFGIFLKFGIRILEGV